jgi:hypothetical protein
MLKMKLGALLGFAVGWAVGSGKAKQFWEEFQGKSTTRPATGPQRDHTAVGDVAARRSQEAAAGS